MRKLAWVLGFAGCVSQAEPRPPAPRQVPDLPPGQQGTECGGWRAGGPPGCSELEPPAASDPRGGPATTGDGAAAGDELTPLERDVAAAANLLRQQPARVVALLQVERGYYDGNLITLPGSDTPIMTNEGVAAVDEAIAALQQVAPRGALALSPGLSAAARGHAEEIGAAGTIDHEGADGSQPEDRMARYGTLGELSGENIGTGYDDGTQMILSLVIDDGVASRGHRTNLLEPAYTQIGVGCARHIKWEVVCVIDLAAGFRER